MNTTTNDSIDLFLYGSIVGEYVKANITETESILQVLEIAKKKKHKKVLIIFNRKLGNIYLSNSDYERATAYYLLSLKQAEALSDGPNMANCLNNLGVLYSEMATLSNTQLNYKKSLSYHLRAIELRKKYDARSLTNSYLNIAITYNGFHQHEKAIEYLLLAREDYAVRDQIHGVNLVRANLVQNYMEIAEQTHSEEFYSKAEKCIREILASVDQSLNSDAFNALGQIHFHQNQINKAISCFRQGIQWGQTLNKRTLIKDGYISLSKALEIKGEYEQALKYHKLYTDLKDTLLNEKSGKQIAEMNSKYDSEKKDKELIKKDTEINRQRAETEKKNIERNAFIVGFVLVLSLAFLIFRGFKQKQNANKLLAEKNIQIENQKHLVEEKNLKITDSINYAKRIQQATLPSNESIKSSFPNSFVFFLPRDIVSGDFYWLSEKNGIQIIAVADCTGHGVPGAFMSMIGGTLLNEIVNIKNITAPHEILKHLNNGIVHILNQGEAKDNNQDDGMDITIFSINKNEKSIEFAGANHTAYLISNSTFEILKGDIFSVGGIFGKTNINFNSKKIKLAASATIYMFTDGFIDQFGGEKHAKFQTNRFEKLVQSLQNHPMDEQHEKLTGVFNEWKGNNKQLDDILIVGIQV